MTHKKIVIGNWKMNTETLEDALRIAKATRAVSRTLSRTEVAVCPPFPFVHAAKFRLASKAFHMGAQSASIHEKGSHTGDVSARMLASLGVRYVIAGHSEERAGGDTDEIVSKRIQRVLEAGLTAVVCVGEKVRDANGTHLEFMKSQIKATFAGVPAEKAREIILAYEPVWAIGAKEAMRPEDVYEMTIFTKKVFADVFGADLGHKVKVLYGGSVTAANAADIIKIGKVDGLLVGRESVNVGGFKDLLKAVDAVK